MGGAEAINVVAINIVSRQRMLRGVYLVAISIATVLCVGTSLPGESVRAKAATDALPDTPSMAAFDESTHTAWTRRDGAPGGISSLAQTKDGYLWIGSSLGLYRFDGVRFASYPFNSIATPLPSLDVSSLAADPEGGLWVGMRSTGVVHLNADGTSVTFGRSMGLTSDTLDRIIARPDGTVWAIAGSKLMMLDKERWVDFGRRHGIPGGGVFSVFFDRERDVWVGQAEKLCVLRKGNESFAEVPVSIRRVSSMAESAAGELWISDAWQSVRPLLDKSSTGVLQIHGKAELLADSGDNLWVAQDYFGLARIRHFGQNGKAGVVVETGRSAEDLTSSETRAILEDREGDVWVGTAHGLDRFQKTSFVQFRNRRLHSYPALLASGDGSVWINSHGSPLMRLLDGRMTAVGDKVHSGPLAKRRNGDICVVDANSNELQCYGTGSATPVKVDKALNRAPAQSMIEDKDGSLLVSFQGKGLWRYCGNWERMKAAGLPSSATWAMLLDSQGRLWLGYSNNLIVMRNGSTYREFHINEGAWSNTLTFYEAEGVIWIAGSDGLSFYDGAELRRVNSREPGLFRGISGIVLDHLGSLWLNAGAGALRVSADEVRELLRNPRHSVNAEVFDEKDGVLGEPTQFKPTPSAVADGRGTLWFATSGNLVSLEPAKLGRKSTLPHILVESVRLNGKSVMSAPGFANVVLHANAGTLRDLEIDYIGIDLSAPERVSYRYRLVGEDEEWQDAGPRRQAFYTRLNPGSYRFIVSASNGEGRWSDLAAPLRIEVSPALYQNWWFRAAGAVLVVALFWLSYMLRVNQLTARMRVRLEERIGERLRIARELHDTLLQSVHGLMLRFHYATETIPAGEPAREHLQLALACADEVMLEGRRRVQDLRSEPQVTMHFAAEVVRLRAEFGRYEGIVFNVTEQGTKRVLNPFVQREMVTILREAVANAFQHAEATRIDVELVYGNINFIARCSDNGIGMEPSVAHSGKAGHWGLIGMQERARSIGANVALRSAPGKGTELEVRISAFRCYSGGGPWQQMLGLLRRNS